MARFGLIENASNHFPVKLVELQYSTYFEILAKKLFKLTKFVLRALFASFYKHKNLTIFLKDRKKIIPGS